MSRTGLCIALSIAALAGVLLAFAPQLDLRAAALFFDPARGMFPVVLHPLAHWTRDAAMWIVALMAVPAVATLAMRILRPHTRARIPSRVALMLIATLALGPGLLVNVGLKDHWGRPRPSQVSAFGGAQPFVPWWDPRGGCARNCSFVAGEASGAFWTLAWAALAPPGGWRILAYGAAIAFGAGTGALRMAFGAHFLSDVVFAGVFVFLVIWLVHGALIRWRWAPSEQDVDRVLSRIRRLGDGRSREQSRAKPGSSSADASRAGARTGRATDR